MNRVQVSFDDDGELSIRHFVRVPFGPDEHGREASANRDVPLAKEEVDKDYENSPGKSWRRTVHLNHLPAQLRDELKRLLKEVIELNIEPMAKIARKDSSQLNYLMELRGDFDHPPEQESGEGPSLTTKKSARKKKGAGDES